MRHNFSPGAARIILIANLALLSIVSVSYAHVPEMDEAEILKGIAGQRVITDAGIPDGFVLVDVRPEVIEQHCGIDAEGNVTDGDGVLVEVVYDYGNHKGEFYRDKVNFLLDDGSFRVLAKVDSDRIWEDGDGDFVYPRRIEITDIGSGR